MTLEDTVAALLAPVLRRVEAVVARGVVRAVKTASKLQGIQAEVEGVPGRVVEHVEPYGYTAAPFTGAGVEAVVLRLGGEEEHELVIAVVDRRYRPKDLTTGEVCVYDDGDRRFYLRRDRAEIRAERIDLGQGATKKVARKDDTTLIDDSTDPAFAAWIGQVTAAVNGLAPGSVTPLVPVQAAGKITSGSSKTFDAG